MSYFIKKQIFFKFRMWNKVFKSRFLRGLESQLIYYFYVLVYCGSENTLEYANLCRWLFWFSSSWMQSERCKSTALKNNNRRLSGWVIWILRCKCIWDCLEHRGTFTLLGNILKHSFESYIVQHLNMLSDLPFSFAS